MKLVKYAIALIVALYIGVSLAEDLAKPFSLVSTPASPWMKSGTGTTYRMTRVDDPDKKVSCYVLDASASPVISCVKID